MQQVHGDEASREILKLIKEYNSSAASSEQLVCHIVACTANSTKEWEEKARDSGMVHVLNKPMQKNEIQQVMDQWFFEQEQPDQE